MLFSFLLLVACIAGGLFLLTGQRPLKWWRWHTLLSHDAQCLPYMLYYPFNSPDSKETILFDTSAAAAAPAAPAGAAASPGPSRAPSSPSLPSSPSSSSSPASSLASAGSGSSASLLSSLPSSQTIRAGTLDKLVQRLTHSSYSDANYAANFLITYRAFSTPTELLEKLIHRYHVPVSAAADTGASVAERETMLVIQQRVGNAVKQWVKTGYRDFSNNPLLMARALYFVELMKRTGNQTVAESIEKAFAKQKRIQEANDAAAAKLVASSTATATPASSPPPSALTSASSATGPATPVATPVSSPAGTPRSGMPASSPNSAAAAAAASPSSLAGTPPPMKTVASRVLAGQLPSRSPSKEEIIASPIPIMPTSDLLADIAAFVTKRKGSTEERISRYIELFASENLDPVEIARQITLVDYELFAAIEPVECLEQAWSKKDKQARAPNILTLIKRFNDLSILVVTMIVKTPVLKDRANIMKKWMLIAQALRELQNFNALVSIVAAMNSSAIHRLKKTMELVPEKIREQFEANQELVGASSNYKHYRTRLHNLNPPCIPYIGVYLSDLTFIEDGNASKLEGLINFDKYRRVAVVVREIIQYQATRYNLFPIPTLVQYFSVATTEEIILDEEAAYKLSLVCEPRQ